VDALSVSKRPAEAISEWGRRIRLACLQRGLSRGELAARSGISRTTLYQIERGGVAQPRPKTLKRIADALDFDVARLIAIDEASPNGRHDAGLFDRSTNPAVDDVYEESPSLFAGWSAAEWDELYSTFGQGGQLTPDGVVQTAVHINRKREVAHRLNVILETHLGDVAAGLIDTLYKLVSPADSGIASRGEPRTEGFRSVQDYPSRGIHSPCSPARVE
jgi:transcriptional regulator with XRE-family HTH domain